MTRAPTSSTPNDIKPEKASQVEFEEEVKRMQSLIAHVQLRASQLTESEAVPAEATEKVEEVATLLEQAETLLEEVEELRE